MDFSSAGETIANYSNLLMAGSEDVNEALSAITEEFIEYRRNPGYTEFLLRFFESCDPSLYGTTATELKNTILLQWDNQDSEFFDDKSAIRADLLKYTMECDVISARNQLAEACLIISTSDFPKKWTHFNQTCIESLAAAKEEGNMKKISNVLYITQLVLDKFQKNGKDDRFSNSMSGINQYWDGQVINIFQFLLEAVEEIDDESADDLKFSISNTIKLLGCLMADDISKEMTEQLPDLFHLCTVSFQIEDDDINRDLCEFIRTLLYRHICELCSWEENMENKCQKPQTEEQVAAYSDSLFAMLECIVGVVANEESSAQTTIAAFKALGEIAKQKRIRDQFYEEHLDDICNNALENSIKLDEEMVEIFEQEPVEYFKGDTGNQNGETKRKAAYDYMKVLARAYPEQVIQLFGGLCDVNNCQSIEEMDTAIFVSSFVFCKKSTLRDGVVEVQEDLEEDFAEFLRGVVIPAFSPDYENPLLQADAAKFYADYRNVIPAETTAECFPSIVSMLDSEAPTSILYAAYLIERLLLARRIRYEKEFLVRFNVGNLIRKLLEHLIVADIPAEIVASCLKRVIATAGDAAPKELMEIVLTKLVEVIESNKSNPDAQFFHNILDTIAAIITRSPISYESKQKIIEPFFGLVMEEHDFYTPYAFQLFAALLSVTPEGTEPSPFFIEQFNLFLSEGIWVPHGNVPALTMLLSAYCRVLPDLVVEAAEGIFAITGNLIPMTRTVQSAFQIYLSMISMSAEHASGLLDAIFGQILDVLFRPDEEIPCKFRRTYSIFMSRACIYLSPDNVIVGLGSSVVEAINQWAENLKFVYEPGDTAACIVGVTRLLHDSEAIPAEQWVALFVGLLLMVERPATNLYAEDIAARRVETEAATEFDLTFSKLQYAEIPTENVADLQGCSAVKALAIRYAELTRVRGDLVNAALESSSLPENARQAFLKYPDRFPEDVSYE